jgi:hypothetical protein
MFLTTVYDLSKDYNMTLGKELIDCYDEVPISQEMLLQIIENYNLEQNNLSESVKTSTVNYISSTYQNQNHQLDEQVSSDDKTYNGRRHINSKRNNNLLLFELEKLNKNKIHDMRNINNGRIRKTNLSIENNGDSKNPTDRVIGKCTKNFGNKRTKSTKKLSK